MISIPSSRRISAQHLGHVQVFAWQQLPALLDERHPAAESSEHLGELDPDVAAAEDEEVLGDGAEAHDRRWSRARARCPGRGCPGVPGGSRCR